MSQDLTITLSRSDLLDTLRNKRTELEAAYDARIQKVQDEIDALPKTAAALHDWYIEVAAMLAAGEARVNAKGEVFATDEDVKPVPDRPNQATQGSNKRNLKHEIENLNNAKEQALVQVDSSIRLLDLATNSEVEIPVSQYERMLSTTVNRRYY